MANSPDNQELKQRQQTAFGEEVRRIRQDRGIKQKAAADRVIAHYSEPSAYRRIELGKRKAERDPAIAILRHGLGLTDAVEIDRLLAILDYTGLTPLEREALGVSAPIQPKTVVPATSRSPIATNWFGSVGVVNSKALTTTIASASVIGTLFFCVALSEVPWFALATCAMFSALFAVSVLLESAFQPDRRKITTVTIRIAAFVLVASAIAVALDRWLIKLGNATGEFWVIAILFAVAGLQWQMARPVLSEEPVVAAQFQTHTAQAAHLKNTVYYLLLVAVFWIPSVHLVGVIRSQPGRAAALIRALQTHHYVFSDGISCLDPTGMSIAMVAFIVYALFARRQLVDNLKPHRRLNVYVNLLYLRGVLFFVFCVLCIFWLAGQLHSSA